MADIPKNVLLTLREAAAKQSASGGQGYKKCNCKIAKNQCQTNRCKNASKTQKKICAVYRENAVSERVCQKWFAKFRYGDFDLKDAPCSGRPVITDDQIKALIDSDRHLTTTDPINTSTSYTNKDIPRTSVSDQSDVLRTSNGHLMDENTVPPLDVEFECLMDIRCTVLFGWLKREETAQTVAKAGLHPKKVMLCIWWDWNGIVYYELLPPNQTIDSTKYCS
ncbi:PREDICTED: histone-lysine N-methyltransferase SETMAR-like [Vollenhovia emeryi]|uniref:histone-lysine N-methyltransferase SETMAR-like n=1 Tax=Vollenhovia emeryi TaxID=411798 RepID=UPI0005F4326F|nr:PREDICTED: histone-lysine N-methyltransferase SETMAR-like [Vollenhovia emeryi]